MSNLMLPGPAVDTCPAPLDHFARLRAMWLHGRPATTQKAYTADVAKFLAACPMGLSATLSDLQQFSDSLTGPASSRARTLSAIRSLFTFACRLNYLPLNPAAALKSPTVGNELAERIITEEDIGKLIAAAHPGRDTVMIRLLYCTGIRVSELTGLYWRNCIARTNGGQISVTGKGSKQRAVLVPPSVWVPLLELRGDADAAAKVFGINPVRVWQILKAAAKDAGLSPKISPHFCRHAHASHSLDHGAPIHLVQQTLGHQSISTTARYTHARPGESSSSYINA